jgi:putative restriction endonuclease
MVEEQVSRLVREAAMQWLDERPSQQVDVSWLANFEYDGRRIPLMDRQRGIRKPAGMDAALSIRTTFTRPNVAPPYADAVGADGLQRYKYRGTDPYHPENVAVRRAWHDGLPLIWFVAVAPGVYEPIYPVYVIGDDPVRLEFTLALDEAQRLMTPGSVIPEVTRRYVEGLTKQRLHQRVFRSQVLLAYGQRCAICQLGHTELLDAAHILSDRHPRGTPVVPNGLSMCKIHHAAFDAGILGIRPDLIVHIRQDVLEEHDGPMLRYGLQENHGRSLAVVPTSRTSRPDRERLEERYATFVSR